MSAPARRAIVTGAGSGIGAATARRLIAAGWAVACLDRNEAAARAVAGDQPVLAVDVADETMVVHAIETACTALGGVDALATCAGVYETTPFFASTAEQIAVVIAWLLSPEAAYVHGATIVADAGMVMH